jgi:RHS repeat-associated protein
MTIGNKILEEIDFTAGGESPLRFARFYNSAQVAATNPNFASSWMHTYSMNINSNSTVALVSRPDGKAYSFNLVNGVWTPDADVSDTLVQLSSGGTVMGWQYTNAYDDSLETYDSFGNLSTVTYRNGKYVTLAYVTGGSAPTFPAPLLSVTDSFGNKLSFTSTSSALTMTDPKGEAYTYGLGGFNQLSSATYPDTTIKSYLYNESAYSAGSFPLTLTGVIDESNSRYDSTWYDTNGLAIRTALAGGVNQYTLTNTLDGAGRIQSVSVANPLGATSGYTFTSSVGRNRWSAASQPAANGQPAGNQSFSFDVNGNTIESTDLNGNWTCSVFDLTRNLETGRVEGVAPGSTCPSSISSYTPASGAAQRKILTQWHSLWHLPVVRAEPLKITTWVYNGDGGSYCAPSTAKVGTNPIGVVCSRSEQGTTDATGGSGFGATASGAARVWSYTYNNFGQVLTAKGPRTDANSTTTYAYYTCTTGAQCGQINTITDAVGHVTTFNTYNGNGLPLTITDPNGVVTTLAYDARSRITSRQVGTETTGYSYYPTGLLNTVTLPDGSTVSYTYDAAHRLTDITDGLGNHIHYTLDAMGNRTAQSAYDPSNVLSRTHSQVFNTLSQLYQDIGAAGGTAVTTTLGYDSNGNQTSVAAPLARNTGNQYDALNRLTQITDAASGVTILNYDANDNLASVTDPKTLQTSYTHDGFGDLTQQVSPATGTTTNTFDSGGNLHTATDARGAISTYGYDALNRVTSTSYQIGGTTDQTLSYTYDTGTNGKGHITGASDANHALAWSYDTLGRVTGKGQTVGGTTLSVGYGYTNGDLTALTTPSGQAITYTYADHQITGITVNATALLTSATYEPFGPVRGWTWGNATTEVRLHDTDGNQSLLTGVESVSFNYDTAYRITGISNSANSALSWTYGYDSLDRLTSAGQTAETLGWSYDADGNRQQQTGASTASPLWTSGAAFRLNDRGRVSSATVGGTTTNYIYNALGQMIEKSAGTNTILMYDEAGHLLGEYTGAGTLVQETVWMGDLPVATLRPNGSGGINIDYIHADQLNTPRTVTRPSDNAILWRWDADPFGTTLPNQNPQGQGTFIYNLRYPGQYYQAETGLNYNYFRDYDQSTGRYVESDPIGLAGGINTYGYVHANPLSRTDPKGLDDSICQFNPSMCGMGPPPPPPSDTGSQCDRCQDSDRMSFTPPAVCAPYDVMCGIGMQAAGIPGPYYPTTHVVSRKCVLGYVTLVKPLGYVASSLFGRGTVLLYGLEYPALGELALTATGPGAGAIALPYAMDEIMKKCSCGK